MAATRNELPEFCPHVACAHTKPEHGMDLRDNVDNLLEVITALFLALDGDFGDDCPPA